MPCVPVLTFCILCSVLLALQHIKKLAKLQSTIENKRVQHTWFDCSNVEDREHKEDVDQVRGELDLTI